MARKQGPTWRPEWADYRRVFEEQDPWHDSGKVPETWAWETERPLARHLASRLRVDEPRRFQLIIGPRRVGKTTSMYQTIKRLLADGIPPKALWSLRLGHWPLGTF
jgi:hypothetical protein